MTAAQQAPFWLTLIGAVVLVGTMLAGTAIAVFILPARRRNTKAYDARKRAAWEAASGMSYPDRHGRTHRLYDYEQEDVA